MTREEFEKHLDHIIKSALRIERYKDDKSIVEAYQKDITHHREKLLELYDEHFAEEEPETLASLQNKKDDIEFHLFWRCQPDSFEYDCYKEDLQEIQEKIDALKKEEEE